MIILLVTRMTDSDLREWLQLQRLCMLYAPWSTYESDVADALAGRAALCN
jgi:hypothetical protein